MSKHPLISKPMFQANQRKKKTFQLSRIDHVNVNHRTETIQDNFRMERLYPFSHIKLFYILLLFREDNRVYDKIHRFTPQSAPSARLVDLLRSSGFGLPAGGREGVEPLEGAWQVQAVLLRCQCRFLRGSSSINLWYIWGSYMEWASMGVGLPSSF